jgi:2-methylcitrate dehydratase PrpD
VSSIPDKPPLEAVGEFVAAVDWADLPERVKERTLGRLLDGIAVAFAGADSPVGVHSAELARRGALGEGSATHWLTGDRGPAEACAFNNTVAMQSILLLDGGLGGHPGSHVVPAAMAVTEAAGGSGKDLLAAIAAGYEVQARFDTGTLRVAPQRQGVRGTPILGCFGAAAAASRASRLSGEQATSALAYATSLAFPTIWEPVWGLKTDERSVQNAGNTLNGVLAARLAEAGFRGSATALDGDGGLYAAWLGEEDERPELVADLGADWISEDTLIHAYPAGGGSLGPIFCAMKVADDHGRDPERIESVVVKRFSWRANSAYVDRGPFTTVEQAVVSTYFGVACALVHGGDWAAIKRGLGDPRVDALAQNIEVTADPTLKHFKESAIEVTFTDGEVARADTTQMPEVLLKPTWAEMVERVERILPEVPVGARADLVAAVEELPGAADTHRLREAVVACAAGIDAA